MKKKILKRLITDEELEYFNVLRSLDNKMAAKYMADLDLFEEVEIEENESDRQIQNNT